MYKYIFLYPLSPPDPLFLPLPLFPANYHVHFPNEPFPSKIMIPNLTLRFSGTISSLQLTLTLYHPLPLSVTPFHPSSSSFRLSPPTPNLVVRMIVVRYADRLDPRHYRHDKRRFYRRHSWTLWLSQLEPKRSELAEPKSSQIETNRERAKLSFVYFSKREKLLKQDYDSRLVNNSELK